MVFFLSLHFFVWNSVSNRSYALCCNNHGCSQQTFDFVCVLSDTGVSVSVYFVHKQDTEYNKLRREIGQFGYWV